MEQIKARLEELRKEHADLWRQVSMSQEFRRLQQVEGAMLELEKLAQQPAPSAPRPVEG